MDKDIIKVIIFFDLFDHPLTLNEIWQYLDKKIPLNDISIYLESIRKLVGNKNGFYFLIGREDIIKIRQKNYNYTNHKIKIAQRFVRFFKLLPFVKAIMLVNSIGSYNLRKGGDIDFFIITSAKRIWLSRLFCTGLAKILNSRPTVNNKKDKICLSFYISEEHYNLDDLMLEDDPYFYYWFRDLLILYNKKETYNNFLVANKLKFDKIIINNKNKNFIFDYLEKIAKKIQLTIMPKELKSKINNSDGVIVSDSVLKFYLRDRRRDFLKKYKQKINEIIN